MPKSSYRLDQYKIIENEHGDLWWETHIGLGSLKSGKCFINGEILFIKPSDYSEAGFLKGELIKTATVEPLGTNFFIPPTAFTAFIVLL